MKNEHKEIGYLSRKVVYRHPQEGLSIERDHSHRVEMTAEELAAWHRQEAVRKQSITNRSG